MNQTIKPIEVVIVNNQNKDSGAEISKIADRYKVKFIEATNLNLSSARNTGIDFSKGRWILSLNAGDIIFKDLIEKAIDKSDIVSSDNGEFKYYSFFRKEVWEKIKGYDVSMNEGNTDHDFWSRAIKEGFTDSVIPKLIFPKKIN